LTGWILLTSQPWGRFYRGSDVETTIQVELYYKHVDRANPVIWQAVCEHHAQGDHWPSLSELKASLVNNGGYFKADTIALPKHLRYEESPWPLRACFTYQEQHGGTLKEAALAVLPVWIKDNAHHEDYADAAQFLEKAKQNFGMKATAGNVRMPV